MSFDENGVDSFIYNTIPKKHRRGAGYFKPSTPWDPIDPKSNYTISIGNSPKIDQSTLVVYFSGSFGHFHDGHLDVLKRASVDTQKITNNYVLVVSPTNSDYCVSKYGAYSELSSNLHRTNHIKEVVSKSGLDNVVIDLNPMLNHYSDQNFTDLLHYFVTHNCGVNDLSLLKHKPVLIGGKDRDYRSITKYTNLVDFWFYETQVNYSTSINIENKTLPKKHLLLRVHNEAEYWTFCEYMDPYYSYITAIYIPNERRIVARSLQSNPITICKDYADLLEYVPLSRTYDTPLSPPKHTDADRIRLEPYRGRYVIDSDIFSGGTKAFAESCGLYLWALFDVQGRENIEVLDVDDFRKPTFRYPYVDLSSKCSLPAFTSKDHRVIADLHEKLMEIKR